MTALLSLAAVTKRFRGLVAVDGVSFAVAPGDIFAVIGPNGAGKTTLFNMIAGVFAPDEGAIEFAQERIDGRRPDEIARRGIGRTFQIVRPFPALSVEDNVVVGALLRARCCGVSTSTTSARGRPPRSPCRTASASRSPARSRPGRSCCCSTR